MGNAEKHEAIRTCFACRKRDQKRSMVRIVYKAPDPEIEHSPASRLIFDREYVEPGRGVYFHPRFECVQKVIESRRLEKALRRSAGEISAEMATGLRIDLIQDAVAGS